MNRLIYKLSRDHEIIICSYTIEELKELMNYKFRIDAKYLDEFLRDFPFILVYSPININNLKLEMKMII